MRRRFGDDALDSVAVRSIDLGVSVSVTEIAHAVVDVVPTSSPAVSGHVGSHRGCSGATSIFQIEDADLGITGCSDDCSIAGMRHEFDGEYVGGVASSDGSG